MDATALLALVVAVVGAALAGAAIAVRVGGRRRARATLDVPDSPLVPPSLAAVLDVLRSSTILLDSRDGVLRATIAEMGQVAGRIVIKAGSVVANKDVGLALELETDDDEMDNLHRQLFRLLLDDHWPHGIEAAIDITLIGRYYERFADHAVSVARRVVFLVTGEHTHNTNGSETVVTG